MLQEESLHKDPDFKKGKALLLEALERHTAHITKVQGPQQAHKISYAKALEELGKKRGGKLFYPYIGSGLGRGPFVQLADGSIKYDCICGIGAHFAHSHPSLISAALDGALSNTIMQGHLQQNYDTLVLSKKLHKLSKIDHCFISTSGAMACENALKIAFQYRHPAKRIFAFSGCFAGRTNTLAQISDRPAYRVGTLRDLHVTYLPFYDPKNPKDTTALQILEESLKRYPGEYAAFMTELVQGEGGFKVAPREFFLPLLERLKKEDIPIIFDEVQTFGRTGEAFAFQGLNLEKYADIVTIGKLAQLCATLYQKRYTPKPGLLSQTYTASSSAIRASAALIDEMQKNNYFGPKGKVNQIHQTFCRLFKALQKRHPDKIEGPFGIGGMCSFTAFKGDVEKTKKLIFELFDLGVICFTCGGDPLRIRFLFPLGALEDKHLKEISEIVEKALLKV